MTIQVTFEWTLTDSTPPRLAGGPTWIRTHDLRNASAAGG